MSMTKILSREEAAEFVKAAKSRRQLVGLASGVFDLIHVGHVRYLESARSRVDVLVVSLNSDKSTRSIKGPSRPIIPETERSEMLAALECVDAVLIFDEPDVRATLRALKPDVFFKGADYTPDTVPERDVVQEYGGRVDIAGDPKNHSSTDIIARLRKAEAL